MTDPTSKRSGVPAGIPIIGEKKDAPFVPVDDTWMRDITAAQFSVNIRTPADLAALMGEEKMYCELCGMEFPLWPIRHWAAHYVHVHHAEITIQQSGGVATLVTDDFTAGVQHWFGATLLGRVNVRRRAFELGLIEWLPPRDAQKSN
jgi:hypothetical protein